MKYADAGVNIAVADDVKQRIRHHASRTFTPGVLGGIGGFGALFPLDRQKRKDPVLVSSADGVGTKPKIAMSMGVHSTVGADLVNHCINDILVQDAEPLLLLDCLPVVGSKIASQLRKPHCCYAPALKNVVARGWVSALAHITGGGIPGNLPRVLPSGVKAEIDLASWPVLPIFKYLAKLGKIDTGELLQSFNMGVGMILVVPAKKVKSVEADLKKHREKFFRIGRIERSESGKARVSYSGSLNL